MSRIQKSSNRVAVIVGLLLTGIPLAFLLAGQFIYDNAASILVFLLFLTAWTAIGILFTHMKMRAKSIYWSLYFILWLVSLVLGLIVVAHYEWFPGWLVFFFPIGGSILLATFYKPFMKRFAGNANPKPVYPAYTQPYEQGYQPIAQNPGTYADINYPYPERPQESHAQDMLQQQ